MATITKKELAIKITDQLGGEGYSISQQDVLEVIQRLITVVGDWLADGDQVVMRNFGTFQVREMKAKIGRNPKHPEEPITIPNRTRVVFRAGKELKEKVDKNRNVI